MDGSRKQSADGMLRRQRPPATRLQSSLRLTQALKKPRWREDGNALIRAQLQQIAIATDDHIGLSGDGQRPEPVGIRIARSAGRCSSIFMPQRRLHQRSVPDVAVDDQPFSFHPRAAGPARPRSYLSSSAPGACASAAENPPGTSVSRAAADAPRSSTAERRTHDRCRCSGRKRR